MKYGLFIAEKAATFSHEQARDWESFLGYLTQNVEPIEGVSRLNEGVYMCDLKNGLNAISFLVRHARNFHIQCRTLFFEQEPSWIYDKTLKTSL